MGSEFVHVAMLLDSLKKLFETNQYLHFIFNGMHNNGMHKMFPSDMQKCF